MTNEQRLWLEIRRGLLLIAGAIEQEQQVSPVLVAVRRGVLLVAGAISREYGERGRS